MHGHHCRRSVSCAYKVRIERTLASASVAQVRVQNEGVGIPADERDRIFAPFYRTARTRDIPGTGLGLHISRRLAEQHRGRLWLDEATSPVTGTVFTLALPLA